MADLNQTVKYTVNVDLDGLDKLQEELKKAQTAANNLDEALKKASTTISTGLVRSISSIARSFGAMDKAMGGLADNAPKVAAVAQATTNLSTAASGAATAIKREAVEARKASTALRETGDAAEQAGKKTDRAFRFLKVFGTFQAIRFTARELFEGIKEGAQQLDLERTLSRQFEGFERTLERARELTAGTVSRGALTKSYALMSSFGIPMDQFAENMELVQKMAIRTGQSADFLTDSFARGISRLSPLILDNLGIQVSLKEANEEYALSVGKSVDALSKQERMAAFANAALVKMRENTEGISLTSDSAGAAVARFETAVADLWTGIKKLGGGAVETIDRSLSGASADASFFSTKIAELGNALPDGGEALADYGKALSGMGDDLADLVERWDELGGKTAGTAFVDWVLGGALFRSSPVTRVDQIVTDIESVRAAFVALDETAARAQETGKNYLVSFFSEEFSGVQMDQVAAAAPYLAREAALERIKGLVADTLSLHEGEITAADEQAVQAAAREAFEKAFAAWGRDVLKLSKEEGRELEDSLVIMTHQGIALDGIYAKLVQILDTRVETRKENEEQLRIFTESTALLDAQIEGAQRLYDIRDGMTRVELSLRDADEARQQAVEQIQKAEEELAEGKESDANKYAILVNKINIGILDGVREELQARKKADAAILDSYRDKTKKQTEMDAARIKAAAEATRALITITEAAGADQATLQSMKEAAAELDNIADKIAKLGKSGGGGGRGQEDDYFFAYKKQNKEKITFYGWTVEDLTEAAGEIQHLFEQVTEAARPKKGELPWGGDTLLGTMSKEELDKRVARFEEYAKTAQRALYRFGPQYVDTLFGEGWAQKLAEESAYLEQMKAHFESLREATDALRDISDAVKTFGAAINEDLIGADVISFVKDLSTNIDTFTAALEANADAYGLTTAAIPLMRQFTAALIKDKKIQAGIEAAMQAAAAWAAWAIPNPAKAIAHTTAALMYAGIAGGVISLPSGGKHKDTTPREGRGSSGGGEAKRPDIHIHMTGTVVQTEAERGVLAREAIAEARRRGM